MGSNILIGQAGGPTMVINQSLVGIIQEAKKHSAVSRIYGALHGIVGIMDEKLINLHTESHTNLERVAKTPSAALGSCRKKPTQNDCLQILEVFRKYEIHYFFYIGGNDSAETALILRNLARETEFDLHIIHIPKTIDNDIQVTDHCPGYPSAARYVAMTFLGNDMENRSLPIIKIDIVMGRDAGFLTAASAMAKIRPDSGPHLIYLPERPVSMDKMAEDIQNTYKRFGRCLVAVADGLCDENGVPLMKSKEIISNPGTKTNKIVADSFDNPQFKGAEALNKGLTHKIHKKLKEKVRILIDTPGYNQRCFPNFACRIDQHEARMVGTAAVQFALQGNIDGSVAIKRLSDGKKYQSDVFLTDLENVAKHSKKMPDHFINAEGNGITHAFIEYLQPLVGYLPQIGFLHNL